MPLQGATVDCPFLTQQQKAPKSGGPVGRLAHTNNCVVKKFEAKDGSEQVRVEQRDGFTRLTTVTKSTVDGTQLGTQFAEGPALLEGIGDRLVGLFEGQPSVYSDAADAWEASPYAHVPPSSMRTLPRFVANSKSQLPDSACIQDVVMTAWIDGTAVWYSVQSLEGAVLIVNTAVGTGDLVKVVADGTHFWLFFNNAGTINVWAYDAHGANLGNTSFALAGATDRWDVTYGSDIGVMLAYPSGGAGISTKVFSWSGSIGVVSHTDNTALCGDKKVAWLTNGSGSLGYLATMDAGNLNAWRIQPSGAQNHQYLVIGGLTAANVLNVTGCFMQDGTNDVVVTWSEVHATDDRQNKTTTVRRTFGGVSTTVSTLYSTSIVSRAFNLGDTNRWYTVNYYGVDTSTSLGQPCFYLYNLNVDDSIVGASIGAVGRFEYLIAWADWNTHTVTASRFQLSTPFFANDGTMRVALCYRGQSTTQAASASFNLTFAGQTVSQTNWFRVPSNTVGIKEYVFGDVGKAVSYAGEVFLPGPQAELLSGTTITEANVAQALEMLTLTPGNVGGGALVGGAKYQYVVVAEGTNTNGDRWFSVPSPAMNVTLGGGDNSVTIVGLTDFVSQRGPGINISIYRTAIDNGVQTTTRYKVTNDLAPTRNSPAGGATWTYVDKLADTVALASEPLYIDKGYLARFPAPAFSQGVAWQNRVWVIGYDGAVWFSGEKTEGDALWYSPAFRVVMPTSEAPVALAQLDGFLVIFCAESIYYIPAGNLPDATGQSGAIPTPVRLPFSNGCTGHVVTTRDGAIYSSSAGGPWIVTRDLKNEYLGAAGEDYFNGADITAIVVDAQQRVCFAVSNGTIVVWDTVAQTWLRWTPRTTPVTLAVLGGALIYGDVGNVDVSPGVWRQDAGAYVDTDEDGGHAIDMTVRVSQVNLGGVRNYKRVWVTQFFGEYLGDHDLSIDVFYDDAITTPETNYSFTPAAGEPYLFELGMTRELCSNVGFEFNVTFPRTLSRGCALEQLAFYVGLEKGLSKLPQSRRVGGTAVPPPPPAPTNLPVPRHSYTIAKLVSQTLGNQGPSNPNGVSNNQRDMLVQVKNAMVASGAWTVVKSCDSASVSTADLWTDWSKIVKSGALTSWIVLQRSFDGVQLCIAATVVGGWTEIQWFLSVKAGFTGGSTTGRATATDEWEGDIPLGSSWLGTSGSDGNTNPEFRAFVWTSTDGAITRVGWWYKGKFIHWWQFDEILCPVGAAGAWVPFLQAFWKGGNDFNAPYARVRLSIYDIDGVRNARPVTGINEKLGMHIEKWSATYIVDQWPQDESTLQYLWINTGGMAVDGSPPSPRKGSVGYLQDIWFVGSTGGGATPVFADGDTAGNGAFIFIGAMMLPWDGTTNPPTGQVSASTDRPATSFYGRSLL